MNDAQRRMAKKALSINSSRKNNSQDLNSSLYDKRTYNEMREGLVDYSADKLKSALSAYITDPIYITSVVNDNGNITINYRLLDENLNEEIVEFELSDGLDYIENIHLYASRHGDCSGRRNMIHRQKPLNCSSMTADDAKKKYKELLTQCYIAVYDHKLDVNDAQVVEYRKQMKKLTDEFGDISATMDNYIASLDKKYKNKVNFVELSLDSGLFSKKQKPSEEILKVYKQLKKSIDNLIKSGTPASNSNLKNMQAKAAEFEKQYDAKSLKMALAASRRGLNCGMDIKEYTLHFVNHDNTLAALVDFDDTEGTYQGEVVWIDENGKPQKEKLVGNWNPSRALAPIISYKIKNLTGQFIADPSTSDDYVEACQTIRQAVKNKWTSENSSRRNNLNSMWSGNTYDDPVIYFTLIPDDVHDTKAVVRGGVEEYTGNYNIELIYLNDNQNQVEAREVTGTFPTDYVRYSFNRKDYDVEKDADMFDNLNNINPAKLLSYIKKVVKAELGTDAFRECDDYKVEARAMENLEEIARYNRSINSSRQRNTAEDEYDIADWADETYRTYSLINNNRNNPVAVRVIITEGTSNYKGEFFGLADDGSLIREQLSGRIPEYADDLDEIVNDYADLIGNESLYECTESDYRAQVNDIKQAAEDAEADRIARIQQEREQKFFNEYGKKPSEWNPIDELMSSANSSRRYSRNRRRGLNSSVARYVGDDDFQTYMYITDDNSVVAAFDLYDTDNAIEYDGYIRGLTADGALIDESYSGSLTTGTNVLAALADFVANETGINVYETNDTGLYNDCLLRVNALFTDKRKSRLDKYTEIRRGLK